jgi:RHS repeat-associated protein
VTNSSGAIVSTIELDPWGADTNRSSNAAFQPKKFTSYERDANGSDEAMFRRYNRWHSRFDQPDPYDGSYDLSNPQSYKRYAYVNGDPVNFVDPSGLMPGDQCFTGSGQPGMEGNDGRCYAGPSGSVTVGDGGTTPSDDPTTYNFVLGSVFSGFTGAGGGGPQDAEVPLTPDQLEAVRKGIETQLTDKCAEFINQLVSSVTGKPYDAKKSLLTDFAGIRDSGGFFLGGTIAGGSASLAGKKVNINSIYSSNVAAGTVVLHEMIHIIAQANDQRLSQGVKALGITVTGYPGYTVPYPTDKDNRNLAYSGYWGQALKNACTARGY